MAKGCKIEKTAVNEYEQGRQKKISSKGIRK